jgi:hypothetical protein
LVARPSLEADDCAAARPDITTGEPKSFPPFATWATAFGWGRFGGAMAGEMRALSEGVSVVAGSTAVVCSAAPAAEFAGWEFQAVWGAREYCTV